MAFSGDRRGTPGDAAIPSDLGIQAQNAGDDLVAQGQDPTASYARAARMIAHYNPACFDARIRPDVSPPDAATRAAALESALGHLEHAVRLGWADAALVEADADLSALHGDPRWGQLLDRLRAGGK